MVNLDNCLTTAAITRRRRSQDIDKPYNQNINNSMKKDLGTLWCIQIKQAIKVFIKLCTSQARQLTAR